jgi:hypothetical protein
MSDTKRRKTVTLSSQQIGMVKTIYNSVMGDEKGEHQEGIEVQGAAAWTPANDKYREEVQPVGQKYGCWECGEKIEDSKNSWGADHIPPWNMHKKLTLLEKIADYAEDKDTKKKPKKPPAHGTWDKWKLGAPMWLLPSCKNCERLQAVLVKKVSAKGADLDTILPILKKLDWNLLRGGTADNKVQTTVRATVAASKAWKGKQEDLSCHACLRTKTSSEDSKYIADHYPPQEFNTNYARELFQLAAIKVPDPVMRPHCPACSSGQAAFKKAANSLQAIAKDVGLAVYK